MNVNLSKHESCKAQKNCIHQSFWNGLGASFLYGDIIAIIAMFYGANELQITLIFAIIHASAPVSLLAPKLMNGADCTTIWRIMWLMRTLVIPLYFITPFISSQYQAWFIVGIFLLYCCFRAIGVSATLAVMQSISNPDNRQRLFAKHMQAFTISSIFVTLMTYVVLKIGIFPSDLSRYQLLVALGLIFSIVSTCYLYLLPHTGTLENHTAKEIADIMLHVVRDRNYRNIIILAMVNTFILVLCGSSIPYMKNIIHISSGGIVFLSSCGLVGACVVMHFIRNTNQKKHSFLLLSFMYAAITCGMLFLISSSRIAADVKIAFFIPAIVLIYSGRNSSVAVISKLQADRLPAGKRYSYSAVFQISAAISAILATSLVAVLRKFGNAANPSDPTVYILVFSSCTLCCIGLFIFCISIFRKYK